MPRAEEWDDDEYWTSRYRSGARHVRPPARARDDGYARRTSDLLSPEHHYTSLHRSRSQGHAPQPNVTIYNTLDADSSPNVHSEQRSPGLSPRRGRRPRVDDWGLEEELAGIRLRDRQSRSRSAHYHYDENLINFERERMKLQAAEERAREADRKAYHEMEEELLKNRWDAEHLKNLRERDKELKRIKDKEETLKLRYELQESKREKEHARQERQQEAERQRIIAEMNAERAEEEERRQHILDKERARKAREDKELQEHAKLVEQKAREAEEERKRIIAENTAKIAKQEREAKEARQRAVDEFNKKKAEEEKEAQEERDRIVAEYEHKKFQDEAKRKQEKEQLIMQLRIDEEKQKAKEKEEWERFLRIQKEKEDKAKAEKEAQEKELEDVMRKRLAQFGFQDNQIQALINPEEQAKLQQQQGMTPRNPVRLAPQPTYVKVNKEHVSIDTLAYYDIPYEFDRADPNYIIILREMEPKETEILFEHTRRLRTRGSNRLLTEEHHNRKPEYAWVRRKSRSRSRRRSSPPRRVVGIKEMFY